MLERLATTLTPQAEVEAMERLAALMRSRDDELFAWVAVLSTRLRYRLFAGMRETIAAVRRLALRADASPSERQVAADMAECGELILDLQTGAPEAPVRLEMLARAGGGDPAFWAHTYLGLHFLEDGDVVRAVEALRRSERLELILGDAGYVPLDRESPLHEALRARGLIGN